MNETNQNYLKDCVRDGDLCIFGIYDAKQDYGIFHKWGRRVHVNEIVKVMKQSISQSKAFEEDVFVVVDYPQFTLGDLERFIDEVNYFTDWYKQRKEAGL